MFKLEVSTCKSYSTLPVDSLGWMIWMNEWLTQTKNQKHCIGFAFDEKKRADQTKNKNKNFSNLLIYKWQIYRTVKEATTASEKINTNLTLTQSDSWTFVYSSSYCLCLFNLVLKFVLRFSILFLVYFARQHLCAKMLYTNIPEVHLILMLESKTWNSKFGDANNWKNSCESNTIWWCIRRWTDGEEMCPIYQFRNTRDYTGHEPWLFAAASKIDQLIFHLAHKIAGVKSKTNPKRIRELFWNGIFSQFSSFNFGQNKHQHINLHRQ